MNEKIKRLLMRQLYMGTVAVAIFVVVSALCYIFPDVKARINEILTKDTDLKKAASLLAQIAKEISPF